MRYSLDNDRKLQARANNVFPNGVYGHIKSTALSESHPQFFVKADGARLWDIDGNEYIDFMCGYGTNLLGYQHPKVEEAVIQQQTKGDCATGPSPIMIDLAEQLKNNIAHAQWSLFAKNGTDATTLCVMAARAQTGRSTVLVAEGAYHGAAPWCNPVSVGLTQGDQENKIAYQYNNIDSLRAAVAEAGDDLAAVIVSPYKHDNLIDQEWPTLEFARSVRHFCDDTGAALILDDVRCAFRFSTGSTWEVLNVLPDLCAMSKSVANGYPLAIVTGNNAFREGASTMFATGSFWFSSVPFAASLATMAVIKEDGVIESIKQSGELFRRGLDELAENYGFKLHQTGPEQMPSLAFSEDPERRMVNLFCEYAVQRGVYLHPFHNMFICAAHDSKTIKEALCRIEKAFIDLKNS